MERFWPKTIAHADMDAFYAAVEQLDNPELRGKPILVGSPFGRGVVLTASYEARPFGVGSAMPMAKARRKCPNALIVPPRMERYQEVSQTIMSVFQDFSPDVEPLSLDEAFLDMSGSEQIFGGPQSIGQKLKDAIRQATGGLTASVGLSGTKYVAKVASAYQKPNGLTIVPPDDAMAWLAPLPVSRLWGAGPKNQKRLHDIAMNTIGDVANSTPEFLSEKLGNVGLHFYALSHAQDPRHVSGRGAAKSIGSEHTLSRDVYKKEDIEIHLRSSADQIGRRLKRKNYLAHGVRTKLKTRDFQLLTRQHRLNNPTDIADTLYNVAVGLLKEFDHPGPFRLVGMAAYDLVKQEESPQMDLFGQGTRHRKLETAIDQLAERFGTNVVQRAESLLSRTKQVVPPTLDFLDKDGQDKT